MGGHGLQCLQLAPRPPLDPALAVIDIQEKPMADSCVFLRSFLFLITIAALTGFVFVYPWTSRSRTRLSKGDPAKTFNLAQQFVTHSTQLGSQHTIDSDFPPLSLFFLS